MKCLNCKFEIPNDAAVCGHCGHPTAEQRQHRNKFFLSVLLVAVPFIGIAILLDLDWQDHVLTAAFLPWVLIGLVFKIALKGKFRKTGML